MNVDQKIEAALQRRFTRAAVPQCPQSAWSATTSAPVRQRPRSRSFAYACAALVILISGGVAAQASGALGAEYAHLFTFNGSSKPLPPLIHRADRFTMAQAQQRMPFSIVTPVGLPPETTFQYAHVISEHPLPRVSLVYQTQIGPRYYRIIVNETTEASGPAVAHAEAEFKGNDGRMRHETWTIPMRRWKHGAIFMEMVTPGLPGAIVDRIVRENTL